MIFIKDEIYGEFQLDGILEELIYSKPVQRLKGIHQGGASYLVNEEWNVTRYEHSIGVMLLIRRLGGSVEEQMAGLLHDVSHTAFSHVVDFVFENKQEDYHETIHEQIIENSEIPSLLEKHSYNIEQLLNESRWTLLEQPAPELCADRVDYTLRDMYRYGKITLMEINQFLESIIVIDGKMYLKNLAAAEWFVETYYKEVIDFFMDPLNIYGYDSLANVIKLALSKKVLELDDLLGTDHDVMIKLKTSNDQIINALLTNIHPQVQVREDKKHYDIHLKTKQRLIDPSVRYNGKLMQASSLSNRVQRLKRNAVNKGQEGTYVKIMSNGGGNGI